VVRAFAAKPVRLINLPHEVTYHATRSMQLEQVHVTVNLHSLYRMVSSILTASRRTPMHGEDYDACYLPSSSIYDTVRRREDCSWWECFHTQQGDTSQHHCVLRDFLGNVQSSRHAASRVAVVVRATGQHHPWTYTCRSGPGRLNRAAAWLAQWAVRRAGGQA
jgi:hypothetical protein